MREIKFRVWDTQLYVMYTDEKDNSLGNAHEPLWRLECKRGGKISYPLGIIMQYTGLKDKNGKEIYEGDILTIITEKPMIVKWSDKFASWCLYRDGWMFAHWFGESCQPEQCIVIGNIYENPELI